MNLFRCGTADNGQGDGLGEGKADEDFGGDPGLGKEIMGSP
jgi:hypothetical protein